jgi:plastocyanin
MANAPKEDPMRRSILAFLVIIALVTLSTPALAGGWATVRLDEPPGVVPAAAPWRFGFMVLQHDVTPNSDVTPIIHAINKETGEEVSTTAEQEGAVGHFVAELTLPMAGEWKWEITPEPFAATSMETLQVVSDASLPLYLMAVDSANGAPAAPRETEFIEIGDDMTFQPHSLEITPGTTVTWTNASAIPHTIMGDDLAFDDSGLIDPGQSFSATFDTPGTYRYRCAPHPFMEGVIVVK